MSLGPSEHLSWEELACSDGTPYPSHWRHSRVVALGLVFEHLRALCGGISLEVSSGYRTKQYQRDWYESQGKKPRMGSQHIQGRAIDVRKPSQIRIATFHQYARECASSSPYVGGVGYYPWGVHLDIRPRPASNRLARWGSNESAIV